MKRIFTIVAVFVVALLQAQTPFITPVAYRGAFAPAPTAMWTTGWTNFDPQNAPYAAGIDSVINTSISTNYTLSGTKKYLLQGLVYVTNNATLTINAGCLIKGDHNVANSSLIITKGAKISAKGTSTKPIVFTSAQPIGSRSKGDWGGIILLGKAHYNGAGGQNYIEGIAQNPNTQYGGGANPDDNDISGTMQYVRIEFGGYIFAPNQEINGLTFGAVGRGTTIDHIQVSYSNDDSYEWFGGTVNCKYLIAYRGLDDNWDTDNGFSGSVQFGLGIRDPNISDNPGISTSEGYESDNDAAGSSNTAFTSALFTNMTDIGPLRGNVSATIASGFRRNVRIRRNSHLRILNSIMMDFPTGVYIDGAACVALATTGTTVASPAPGNLVFKNNLLAGQQAGKVCERNVATFDIWSWFGANKNDSLVSTSGILIDPYATATQTSAGDLRPAPGSPALTNTNWNDSAFFYVNTDGSLATLITCPAAVATPVSIIGKSLACAYIGSGDTAKYYVSAPSILGVLKREWAVPTGVTIVSGQGTDSLIVTYDNTFPLAGGSITVKNLSYCGVYSAARALAIKKGVPGTAGVITGPAFICDYITNATTATYNVPALLYATSYLWTVPTGATIVSGQGTTSIDVTFDNTFTTGSITVKGVAPCGQSAVARSFVLTKLPAAPGYISGLKSTCGHLNTSYTYSIAPVTNATSYIWTVPVGASIVTGQGTTSIDVSYASVIAGTIYVKSVTSCGESAARAFAVVKVGTPATITGSNLVCFTDNDFTYTVADTLNNPVDVTYTWTVPAGATITGGQTTSSITVAYDPSFLSGNITVKAIGCGSYSSVKTFAVSKDPSCVGSRFAGKNVTVKATEEKLVVSPNPSKGNFTVHFATSSKANSGTIQITNSFGQVVSQRTVAVNNGTVNEQIAENKLAPGVYILKFTAGSETKTTKIVVE